MKLIAISVLIGVYCAVFVRHVLGKCVHPPANYSSKVSLSIFGEPKYFISSNLYTISVTLGNWPLFTEFMVTSEGTKGPGSFQILNDGLAAFSEDCLNTVVDQVKRPKGKVRVLWTTPYGGCVTLRASVLTQGGWLYTNRTICALAEEKRELKPPSICCACDHAKYQIIFEGLWSPSTHPKDFPTSLWLTHFSDVIGASHSGDFTLWAEGGKATYGFKQLAEFGVIRELETELRNASSQLRSIVKAAGLWYPNLNGNTSAVFRVDPRRHFLSLASMFGPSPDWVVGVSSLDLCQSDCSWLESKVIDLYPYDAGTDNGITYMSTKSATDPQQNIMRITPMYPEDPRAPFYDPNLKEVPPVARLYLNREKIIPKSCSDLTDSELLEQVSITENTEEGHRAECGVTPYSPWSPCSVTCGKGLRMRSRKYIMPEKAAMFKCDRQLVSKEMCVANESLCPGDEEEEEEISQLWAPGECDVTKWSEWSDCSVTCGIGFIVRTRTFLNDTVAVHKKCMLISTMEKEKCMLPVCRPHLNSKVSPHCKLSEWSNWSPCSVTCGTGVRSRVRRLTPGSPPFCATSSVLSESNPCSFPQCESVDSGVCHLKLMEGPCRGTFTKWGFSKEKNTCVPFNYGGCRGNKNNFNTREECLETCRTQIALEVSDKRKSHTDGVKNCLVSNWSEWTDCSPCPNGTRIKTRTVLEDPKNGGTPCPILKKVVKCSIPVEFCNHL